MQFTLRKCIKTLREIIFCLNYYIGSNPNAFELHFLTFLSQIKFLEIKSVSSLGRNIMKAQFSVKKQ